jgi:hypothetical protein
LDIFPWALLAMGPCAVVAHVWKYYIITLFFVHFPLGFFGNGSECEFVGFILKRTKGNKRVCKVGLIEQPLANQTLPM